MKFAGQEPEKEFCVIRIERGLKCFGTRKRSFTYNVNSNGPKIDLSVLQPFEVVDKVS